MPRLSSCLPVLAVAIAGDARALDWESSPLAVSLRLPGGGDEWSVAAADSLPRPLVFSAQRRRDGAVLTLAVRANDIGLTASEAEKALRRGGWPKGLRDVEIAASTHQTLPAVDLRALVDRADGRWSATMRQVPTRKHIYIATVMQPAAVATPPVDMELLAAVRLTGTPAAPPLPEPTPREQALSKLLGEGFLVLLLLGVVVEGLRRRRRAREQASHPPPAPP